MQESRLTRKAASSWPTEGVLGQERGREKCMLPTTMRDGSDPTDERARQWRWPWEETAHSQHDKCKIMREVLLMRGSKAGLLPMNTQDGSDPADERARRRQWRWVLNHVASVIIGQFATHDHARRERSRRRESTAATVAVGGGSPWADRKEGAAGYRREVEEAESPSVRCGSENNILTITTMRKAMMLLPPRC